MLSVAVHKDIAEYQPKIVGKMTMRTLVSITGALLCNNRNNNTHSKYAVSRKSFQISLNTCTSAAI